MRWLVGTSSQETRDPILACDSRRSGFAGTDAGCGRRSTRRLSATSLRDEIGDLPDCSRQGERALGIAEMRQAIEERAAIGSRLMSTWRLVILAAARTELGAYGVADATVAEALDRLAQAGSALMRGGALPRRGRRPEEAWREFPSCRGPSAAREPTRATARREVVGAASEQTAGEVIGRPVPLTTGQSAERSSSARRCRWQGARPAPPPPCGPS